MLRRPSVVLELLASLIDCKANFTLEYLGRRCDCSLFSGSSWLGLLLSALVRTILVLTLLLLLGLHLFLLLLLVFVGLWMRLRSLLGLLRLVLTLLVANYLAVSGILEVLSKGFIIAHDLSTYLTSTLLGVRGHLLVLLQSLLTTTELFPTLVALGRCLFWSKFSHGSLALRALRLQRLGLILLPLSLLRRMEDNHLLVVQLLLGFLSLSVVSHLLAMHGKHLIYRHEP